MIVNKDLVTYVYTRLLEYYCLFSESTSQFESFTEALSEQKDKETVSFLSKDHLAGFHILLAATLLMMENHAQKLFKQLLVENESIKVVWSGGIVDRYQFTLDDKNFVYFLRGYRKALLTMLKDMGIQSVSSLVQNMIRGLSGQLSMLKHLEVQMGLILKSRYNLCDLLAKSKSTALVLCVLTTLPIEDVDVILTTLSEYIPPEVDVYLDAGTQMSLKELLGSRTLDSRYILNKVTIYMMLLKESVISENNKRHLGKIFYEALSTSLSLSKNLDLVISKLSEIREGIILPQVKLYSILNKPTSKAICYEEKK